MKNAPVSTTRRLSLLKDSRLWWMIFSSMWVLMILSSAIQYFFHDFVAGDSNSSGTVPQKAVGIIVAVAFVLLYFRLMYRVFLRDSWEIELGWDRLFRFGMLGLAILLNVLPGSGEVGFNFAFIFVAVTFVLTSNADRAFQEVLQICAVASVVLLLSGNGERIGITLVFTIAFGFMVGSQHRNFSLIRDLYVERSRVRDQAVTDERFRLARDLHDTVGHSMTQITLKAELARRILPNDPSRAATELKEIEQLSRSLSAEVRRSIAGEVDLSLAVEIGRARELLPSMGIEVSVSGEVDTFPEEIAEAFAWCLREGVMNTIKHSGATRCEIEFATNSDHHLLAIRDNGANQIVENESGQGIQGMTHRVQALSGEVKLEMIESGHRLSIRIPA